MEGHLGGRVRRCCVVFSRYAASPRDGKQSQFYKLLPILAELFPRVEVLALARDPTDLDGAAPPIPTSVTIEPFVARGNYEIQSLLFGLAGFVPSVFPSVQRIRRWIQKRDDWETLFFFEGFPLAGLLRVPRRAVVVWGEVDSYLRRAHRMYRLSRGVFGRIGIVGALLGERIAARYAAGWQVYSEEDARFLRKFHGYCVRAVPVVYEVTDKNCERSPGPSEPPTVLVWADTRYLYLEKSVERLLPTMKLAVREKIVQFTCLLGENASLQQRITKCGIKGFSRVENLDEFLSGFDYVVIPDLAGTGLKNRTLYALSRGCCVLGTRLAWEGIPFRDGESGFLISCPEDILATVARLANNPRYSSIGRAGRRLVASNYSAAAVGRKWRELFQQAMNSGA